MMPSKLAILFVWFSNLNSFFLIQNHPARESAFGPADPILTTDEFRMYSFKVSDTISALCSKGVGTIFHDPKMAGKDYVLPEPCLEGVHER